MEKGRQRTKPKGLLRLVVVKINRSTKLDLNCCTAAKLAALQRVLTEYARVVNCFIADFWLDCPKKAGLLKPVVDSVDSWFGARMRKVAAREAIDMVMSCRRRDGNAAVMPVHNGKRMCLSSTIAELQPAKTASGFDAWLHLQSIGEGINLNLPLKYHRHFNSLAARGRLMASYVVTKDTLQLCFEIETGPKRKVSTAIGLDTGIKALASLSTAEQLGTDIELKLDKIKRCKHGSKAHKRAARSLRQRIDEVAKQAASKADLIVVESLKGITIGTKAKRRLAKNMRRTLGNWNLRHWLTRLEQRCEDNRVVFRSVPAAYTSQTCPVCSHVERGNRKLTVFLCRDCGYTGNADITAAKNILSRFLLGPYGAEFKHVAA
jgi:hypothetical protein